MHRVNRAYKPEELLRFLEPGKVRDLSSLAFGFEPMHVYALHSSLLRKYQ